VAAASAAVAATSAAAAAAAAGGGRRVTRVWRSHDGLQPYLDWLCIRLPVERLPSRYRPGGLCVHSMGVFARGHRPQNKIGIAHWGRPRAQGP
jgi:hypothetical protein